MVVRGFLKFLAAFLAAALIFIIILGVVGFFAARNFDPNMFRAEFEKYLTQQTGFRVELGDIKLRWRPQPQLQVAGLKLYQSLTFEQILQSDQVRLDMDLTSIWKKRFNMSQALIQSPVIFLKRDKTGGWNWQFAKSSQAPIPAAAPSHSQGGLIPTAEASEGSEALSLKNLRSIAQGWEFEISRVLVRDATVRFVDETVSPAFKFEIEKLEAEARQKNVVSLFHFKADGAVFGSAKKNLEAEGDFDLTTRSLDLLLRYGPDKAEFKGKLSMIKTIPHFEGTLDIRDLDMDSVIPEVYKKGYYVAGRLSAKANLSFDGSNPDPDMIKRSFSGQGTLEIKEGALRNRNLIKEVFDRLSPVLAITDALGGELPPELSDMLKDRDTPFDYLQVAYAAQAGIFRISEFQLIHPNYQLAGQGSYEISNKRIESAMQLGLSKSISAYLMKKIKELALLADAAGQILIPFRYGGIFPDASVQPDLPYIGSRLLQGGADQLLNFGLGKLSKKMGQKKDGQASALGMVLGGGQTSSSAPVSEQDQLIQQGMALFTKYKVADRTGQTSPVPVVGQASSAGPVSEQDQLIQQGLALLAKYRETEKK